MTEPGHAALWLAVIALGAWHGLNPAMGWPLAVANALSERREAALFGTLLPLGAGHLAAMLVVLLPFAALAFLYEWGRALRVAAGALVLAFGLYRWFVTRHPRFLARVPPTRLAWWSFLMASAHGAGWMLLPVALGLCATPAAPDDAAAGPTMLLGADIGTAVVVALLHTLAMLLGGVSIAWIVYRWLGLQFLRRAWFNLDRLWAASLVLAGVLGIATALWAPAH